MEIICIYKSSELNILDTSYLIKLRLCSNIDNWVGKAFKFSIIILLDKRSGQKNA